MYRASSCSFAENNDVLSCGQMASGDLPLTQMNEQTTATLVYCIISNIDNYTCHINVIIQFYLSACLHLQVSSDADGCLTVARVLGCIQPLNT